MGSCSFFTKKEQEIKKVRYGRRPYLTFLIKNSFGTFLIRKVQDPPLLLGPVLLKGVQVAVGDDVVGFGEVVTHPHFGVQTHTCLLYTSTSTASALI